MSSPFGLPVLIGFSAAVLCASVVAGCGSSAQSSPASTSIIQYTRRPFEFERADRVVRWTPEGGQERKLDVDVYVPKLEGPLPVIVFAHGYVGHPSLFGNLFSHWAYSGYIVAAPRFPHSARDVEGVNLVDAVGDMQNQAHDLSKVLDELIRANSGADDRLRGAIDESKVAVAGLSLGGGTALLAAYDDCCADPRFKAAIAMSPVPVTVKQGGKDGSIGGTPPVLLIHGTKDEVLAYSGSQALFAASKPGTDFLTLVDAGHSSAYEDQPSGFDLRVGDATTAYLDATLNYQPGDTVADREIFYEVVDEAEQTKIESKERGG